MTLEGIFFAAIAVFTIYTAYFVVTAHNLFRSAIGLTSVLIGVAGLYLLMDAVSGDCSLVSRGTQFTLQTNVYEASSKRLVLSATSQTVGPESVEEIGREICRVTVTSLADKKLLRR